MSSDSQSSQDQPERQKHPLRIPGFEESIALAVHEAGDSHVSVGIARDGIWEEKETALMLAMLKPGDVVVDVGANIGYFTVLASKIVGDSGVVHAFEPEAENFDLLQYNCAENQCTNVVLHQAGLSDQSTQGTLYLNPENRGDHQIFATENERDRQTITLLTGAEVFAGQRPPNFIKVDTQGAETSVLKGLEAVLRDAHPELIMMIEFSPNDLRAGGSSAAELLALLQRLPGQCYAFELSDQGLLPADYESLAGWAWTTEQRPDGGLFLNLVYAGRPLVGTQELPVREDCYPYKNLLGYLYGNLIPPWDGAPLSGSDINKAIHLCEGWQRSEPEGIWSIAERAKIIVRPADEFNRFKRPALQFTGQYYQGCKRSRVQIGDSVLGELDLRDAVVPIPENAQRGDSLLIILEHEPAADEPSSEQALRYGLERISAVDL